jgi:hypothetical protein
VDQYGIEEGVCRCLASIAGVHERSQPVSMEAASSRSS